MSNIKNIKIWRSQLEKGEPSLRQPQFAEHPFYCSRARDITDLAISANLQFEVEGRKPKTKGTATLIQIEMVYLNFKRFQSWDLRQKGEKDENDECLSETPSALLLFKVWLEGKYYYLLFNLRERLHRVSFLEIMSLEIRTPFLGFIILLM